MVQHVLLSVTLVLSVLIASLHAIALHVSLYWKLPWFDECMHLLGGLLLGIGISWLTVRFQLHAPLSLRSWRTSSIIMGLVLLVSIGWELFEVWAGIPIYASYVSDTVSDLVMDVLGGGLGIATAALLVTSGINTFHTYE